MKNLIDITTINYNNLNEQQQQIANYINKLQLDVIKMMGDDKFVENELYTYTPENANKFFYRYFIGRKQVANEMCIEMHLQQMYRQHILMCNVSYKNNNMYVMQFNGFNLYDYASEVLGVFINRHRPSFKRIKATWDPFKFRKILSAGFALIVAKYGSDNIQVFQLLNTAIHLVQEFFDIRVVPGNEFIEVYMQIISTNGILNAIQDFINSSVVITNPKTKYTDEYLKELSTQYKTQKELIEVIRADLKCSAITVKRMLKKAGLTKQINPTEHAEEIDFEYLQEYEKESRKYSSDFNDMFCREPDEEYK